MKFTHKLTKLSNIIIIKRTSFQSVLLRNLTKITTPSIMLKALKFKVLHGCITQFQIVNQWNQTPKRYTINNQSRKSWVRPSLSHICPTHNNGWQTKNKDSSCWNEELKILSQMFVLLLQSTNRGLNPEQTTSLEKRIMISTRCLTSRLGLEERTLAIKMTHKLS